MVVLIYCALANDKRCPYRETVFLVVIVSVLLGCAVGGVSVLDADAVVAVTAEVALGGWAGFRVKKLDIVGWVLFCDD